MIYITGDTHGDYSRFTKSAFPLQDTLTKDDYVIICGDFGIWDNSKVEKHNFDFLENRPFTTLFVDGNHENYDLLQKFPVEKWHGGDVQFIRPSVIRLMRGNLYDIDGKSFFVMGGAASHDIQDGILDPRKKDYHRKKARLDRHGRKYYRVKGISWWEQELPSDDEYKKAEKTLNDCGWSVDYILTHCAPDFIVEGVFKINERNRLTQFLGEVGQKCEFKKWFFGHYHRDLKIGDRFYLLYKQIIALPE